MTAIWTGSSVPDTPLTPGLASFNKKKREDASVQCGLGNVHPDLNCSML